MSLKKSKELERNIKKSNRKIIDIKFDCEKSFKTKEIKSFVKKSVDQTLEILEYKKRKTYVSVFLTNNEEIKKINSKYRNINQSTNVLSFPQNEKRMVSNLENYLVLGDIVISLEKILSEANEQKKNFFDHLLHMIVHSALHLYGFDHTNQKEWFVMEAKEKDIMKKILSES